VGLIIELGEGVVGVFRSRADTASWAAIHRTGGEQPPFSKCGACVIREQRVTHLQYVYTCGPFGLWIQSYSRCFT
jgi:hypothetical protein